MAIRHAIKKPLVQIIKKGEAIPFDVAGTRTVHVDHHDLDSVEEAKEEIVKQIKAVEKDASEIDTPISVALDLQILRQSENPEQRSIADMIEVVSELRTGLQSIEKKISDPSRLIPPEIFEKLLRPVFREIAPVHLDQLRALSYELSNIADADRYSEKDKQVVKNIAEAIYRIVTLKRYTEK